MIIQVFITQSQAIDSLAENGLSLMLAAHRVSGGIDDAAEGFGELYVSINLSKPQDTSI